MAPGTDTSGRGSLIDHQSGHRGRRDGCRFARHGSRAPDPRPCGPTRGLQRITGRQQACSGRRSQGHTSRPHSLRRPAPVHSPDRNRGTLATTGRFHANPETPGAGAPPRNRSGRVTGRARRVCRWASSTVPTAARGGGAGPFRLSPGYRHPGRQPSRTARVPDSPVAGTRGIIPSSPYLRRPGLRGSHGHPGRDVTG